MKHLFKSILLWLGLSSLAWGGPQNLFNNIGLIDTPTNISAVHVNNAGEMVVGDGLTLFNIYNTKYFNNSGTMFGFPGLRFADVTGSAILPSLTFTNTGLIVAEDGFTSLLGLGALGGNLLNGNIIGIVVGGNIPSKIEVNSTSVINQGALVVGNDGTMDVTGKNVDLSYGILEAGSADTSASDNPALAEQYVWVAGTPNILLAQDEPNTFDLLWGVTNNLMGRVSGLITPDTNGDGLFAIQLPPFIATNGDGQFTTSITDGGLTAFAFTYGNATNYNYDVVLLSTNFNDPNTSVKVQFGDPTKVAGFNYVPLEPGGNTSGTGGQNYANGIPIVVTYSEAAADPITGNAVVNSIVLEDDGDTLGVLNTAQTGNLATSFRPDAFELTFSAPPRIPPNELLPTNTIFEGTNIFVQGAMAAVVAMTNAVYEAQVGVNPESLDGVFGGLTGGEGLAASIPNITNSPGRITINAKNLNLHNMRLSGQGLLTINATNVTGLPSVFNYSTADLNLGSLTNSLIVSNVVPVLFEQLRGDIEGYSATWDNVYTNTAATNTVDIHTHVLYVTQNLSARYTPTIRKFFLKSTNIVVQDDVEVLENDVFNGRNLTITSNLFLTQEADSFTPANAPNLKNLLVNAGGSLIADSLLDVGFHPPIVVSSPIGRGYSVLTVTNDGFMAATGVALMARTVANDGIIESLTPGSVLLAANTLSLGFNLPTNTFEDQITAGGAVTLSANTIEATNTTITANQLILTPVTEMTDFTAEALGTNIVNGVSDLDNFWTVNNELVLTRKPAKGDLYGTQIQVIANAGPPTIVRWAGADRGDNPNGFVNNAVIGTLVLDRVTNTAVIQFEAAGGKNALYVNNLVLQDASLTNYTDNTIVDPRLTIYFAAANVPVNKLTNISPQFVYAANSVASESFASALRSRSSAALPTASSPIGAPLVTLAGVYSGLFAPTTGVSAGESGYLTFTLDKNGTFSGHVLIGSKDAPFSSRLVGSGVASVNVGELALNFTIDSSGNLAGAVTGEGWDADLSGAIAASGVSPYAGHYVMTLPGPGDAGPTASSLGHVTVNPEGILTASGRLADGAMFSQSARINRNGQWPFYAYAPARKDVLMGWLNFAGDPAQISGSVTWLKPALAVGAYREGFEGVVQVTGAKNK